MYEGRELEELVWCCVKMPEYWFSQSQNQMFWTYTQKYESEKTCILAYFAQCESLNVKARRLGLSRLETNEETSNQREIKSTH